MKNLILFAMLAFIISAANSQTSEKKWGAGLGLGAYGTFGQEGIGLMPEGYFSRYLSPRIDLMLKGNLGMWNSNLESAMDLAYPSLNLRLKLSGEENKFRPYLYAGGGFLADNSDYGASFDLGIGGKYYFNPNTALYFDAGYINGIDATVNGADVHDNIWKVTAGIEVDFGKVKDADMDGVSDKKDKCPETPAGVTVDAAGCPVDTDGDGVADYIDDCPSVAGLSSLKGCPDTDKDGIADKDDACPDVAGLMNLKGCPDSDGDGVTDKSDKCPNTKKGYKVDASGCPFDKDNDGIIDEEDGCPAIAGPVENKGCPIPAPTPVVVKEVTPEQVVMQNITVPSVHFVSNKSYLTDYSKGILDKLVTTLNKDQSYNVNIYGYTDSQGSDEYNMKLSKARAESVADYLISKGISKDRILKQKALGKSKPIASNNTEEGRLQNRRVEFEIFKMK